MLILKTSTFHLQGKLYDYYLPSDIHNCQEEQDVDSSEGWRGALVRGEREKDVHSEDKETVEGKRTLDDGEETEDSTELDKPGLAGGINGLRRVDNEARKSSAV